MERVILWKFEFRGNYGDLCKKLGQELFEDVTKVQFLRHHIPTDLVQQMQTLEGRNLLESIVRNLTDFEHRLTSAQRQLRKVCQGMNIKNHTSRPSWTGGAHLFVTPAVASEIQHAFGPGELRKGHVVVSDEFLDDFLEATK